MFENERYNELISSAFEAAYADEMEKLGQGWLTGAGRLALQGAKYVPQAGRWLGATRPVQWLAKIPSRLRYSLGLGVRGAKPGTKAYYKELERLSIPGVKVDPRTGMLATPRTEGQLLGKATKETEKLIPRARMKLLGRTPEQEARRIAERLAREEAGAAKTFELTGGTLPGTVRAMATHPLQTMGAGYRGMSPSSKVMFAGVGALSARDLAKLEGKTPEEKAEIIARAGAGAPLWLATGGMTTLPSLATYLAGEEAAATRAKALTRKLRGQPPVPEQEDQYELTPEEIAAMREGAV